VVLLSDATPGRNGVGTYYDDLADHLRERLGGVILLTPPLDPAEAFEGWITGMPGDPTQKIYFPSPRMFWRRVRAFDPHVIISGTPGGFGMLGLLMAALLRTAFAVGYHTEYAELAGLYWKGRFGTAYKGIMALWDQMMFRFGSTVLVTNETLRDMALAWGARSSRIVGTPTHKSFLDRPLAPLPEEIGTVTYVGRLAPEKELGEVRRAAAAYPSLRFRIAGDGLLRPQVESWAAELANLEYVGWLPRDQVLDLLDRTDLLVLPSRFETFGTAAFEALVRRRLVLVSASCGIVQFPELSPGLFRIEQGEDLAGAVGRLRALGPDARRRVAEEGARAARLSAARTVDDWVEVLASMVLEKRFL
jgi:glycosyltransferase involved in cell wall biosynthesis